MADGLRLNRTLLVLNLAGNAIGDAGATQLATVLSAFELSHEDLVERRRLLLARRLKAGSRHTSGSKLGSRTSSVAAHPQRGRKRAHGEPSKNLKSGAGKAGKSPRQQSLLDEGRGKKDKGGKKTSKKTSAGGLSTDLPTDTAQSTQSQTSLLSDKSSHPLMSLVVLRQSTVQRPTTLVRGNRSLLSLNLSRNEIGPVGMAALRDTALPLRREPVKDITRAGLLRLTVDNNRVPSVVLRGLARTTTQHAAASTTVPAPTDAASRAAAARVNEMSRLVSAVMLARDPLARFNRTTSNTSVKSETSGSHINVMELIRNMAHSRH